MLVQLKKYFLKKNHIFTSNRKARFYADHHWIFKAQRNNWRLELRPSEVLLFTKAAFSVILCLPIFAQIKKTNLKFQNSPESTEPIWIPTDSCQYWPRDKPLPGQMTCRHIQFKSGLEFSFNLSFCVNTFSSCHLIKPAFRGLHLAILENNKVSLALILFFTSVQKWSCDFYIPTLRQNWVTKATSKGGSCFISTV